LKFMRDLVEKYYSMKVVVGTHPIPTTFWERHNSIGSWDSEEWQEAIKAIKTDEKTRLSYV
jgi:hypothetical protein